MLRAEHAMKKVKWMFRQHVQKTAPATHIGMAPQKNTFFLYCPGRQ